MIAALMLTCALFIAIAIGVSVTERPKRNRYRRSHDPRDWMQRYRMWWVRQ